VKSEFFYLNSREEMLVVVHFFVLNVWVVMTWVMSCIMLICFGVSLWVVFTIYLMEDSTFFFSVSAVKFRNNLTTTTSN
jgi:type IV secretory pathway VirB3-like protein